MPIYEYHCDDCGNEFEKRVARASDADSVECPSCGQRHLTQRLSTFAAVTNGSTSGNAAPSCPSGGCCPMSGVCGQN